MTTIDQATSFTILATGVAGAGSLAMVATGFATLTAPLAVPLSAAITGPMAIACLYEGFTNPEERKLKEIHNKLQDIEEGIRKVLQGANETQAATLEAVANEFYSAAEWYLVPLVHSSRRAVDIVACKSA